MNDTPRTAAKAESIAGFGSDAIAELLRALEIPYIALTPGASFRGLHDSLVNHLGNTRPKILLCVHEENAVALAHGYARVTGKPLAVALHANVGLMHATMAIFNAWCDRMPILMVGGVGPMDAMKRRPWVDWIHTSRDLGALIRGYIKVGRPAGFGAGRARSDRARVSHRDDGAARPVFVPRRGAPGRSVAARAAAAARSLSVRGAGDPPADAVGAAAALLPRHADRSS